MIDAIKLMEINIMFKNTLETVWFVRIWMLNMPLGFADIQETILNKFSLCCLPYHGSQNNNCSEGDLFSFFQFCSLHSNSLGPTASPGNDDFERQNLSRLQRLFASWSPWRSHVCSSEKHRSDRTQEPLRHRILQELRVRQWLWVYFDNKAPPTGRNAVALVRPRMFL